MKAFILDRYGRKSRLRLGEMPEPELRDDEVLIQVHAASVNPLDAKIRNGDFKLLLPYRLPLVLGHDVAGVVVRVGPRVRSFKPGDEVYSRPDGFRIGAFAEFIAVKEASLAIKPKNLSMEEAAPSRGQGVPVRIDPGGDGLRRIRTRQGQSRYQDAVNQDLLCLAGMRRLKARQSGNTY